MWLYLGIFVSVLAHKGTFQTKHHLCLKDLVQKILAKNKQRNKLFIFSEYFGKVIVKLILEKKLVTFCLGHGKCFSLLWSAIKILLRAFTLLNVLFYLLGIRNMVIEIEDFFYLNILKYIFFKIILCMCLNWNLCLLTWL